MQRERVVIGRPVEGVCVQQVRVAQLRARLAPDHGAVGAQGPAREALARRGRVHGRAVRQRARLGVCGRELDAHLRGRVAPAVGVERHGVGVGHPLRDELGVSGDLGREVVCGVGGAGRVPVRRAARGQDVVSGAARARGRRRLPAGDHALVGHVDGLAALVEAHGEHAAVVELEHGGPVGADRCLAGVERVVRIELGAAAVEREVAGAEGRGGDP